MVIYVDRQPFGHAAFTPYPFVHIIWDGVKTWDPVDRECLIVHEQAHTIQHLALSVVNVVALAVLAATGLIQPWLAVTLYLVTLPLPMAIAWALPPLRRELEDWADDRQKRCERELRKRNR